MASVDVELARQHWDEGRRRLEATRDSDPALYGTLVELVEIVIGELRARIGQSFTIDELVTAYGRAEDWSREAIAEADPPAGWPRHLATVADTAFHEYARGATDYEP